MPLRLRDHLTWCDCNGRAIFLDLEADRYFCLPNVQNEAFLRLARCETQSEDSKRLASLVERGMLVPRAGAAAPLPVATIDAPADDYLREPIARPSPLQVVEALAAEIRAAWMLSARPLKQVLASASGAVAGATTPGRDPHRTVTAIVAAASACAFVTRSHNRCLVRALAVHSRCGKSGIRAKMVFGVVARPFEAHCWVQLGRAVLVGGFEQARLFTPILVVQ